MDRADLKTDHHDEIDSLLSAAKTIAVVGLSDRPTRDSHSVARYLQANGYRVVPINPNVESVLGERAYPDLAAVPGDIAIDVVDVFRRPEHVAAVVEAAIARGVPAVWMQLGVHHREAAARARDAGLKVVENRCIKVEHARRNYPQP